MSNNEFINIDGKIPVAEWFKLIIPIMREGYQLKICPSGTSMIPFLVGGRDEAVLSIPAEDFKFRKNDIILYRIENGVHVLHRICRISEEGIYTLGDAQTQVEGPLKREEIIAVADYIIRKGKKITRTNLRYNILAVIWRMLRPFRRTIMDIYTCLFIKKNLHQTNNKN
ncbi:MAG: S24/S26 family peptidase [Lachnospiraceae bacterium]|nr:S24/S26 family peptidase [Lachnospiraceae bacterium]